MHACRKLTIDDADVENKHPIVVINETFAQHVWPNENPIGKRIREGTSSSDALWKEVVGVVGDVKQNGLDTETELEAYEPYSLDPPLAAEIVFSADSPTVISGVRATLHSLNSGLPLADALTMDQILAARLAPQRFTLAVMGVFAALALVLAVIGIYAVMSYMVTQRVQEIGIRIALGATPGRVFYMLGKQAFTWTITGLLVGTIIALALKRFIVSILFGVSSADPLTFVIVWVVLIGVALLASYLPARRATKIDPLIGGASRNAIIFHASDATAPFVTRNAELLDLLAPQFEEQLRQYKSEDSFIELVRQVIQDRLTGQRPSIDAISQVLHVSPRTLQRRLQESGSTFQRVLDEARHQMARYYLSNSALELNEAAYLLGFEDPNSFGRAFRAWEGMPPSDWKETHQTSKIM
jgi:AraC-like DNA-binding protein